MLFLIEQSQNQMATETSKFRVGLFVFSSIVILVLILMLYGSKTYFSETEPYVTYFAQSIQGLDVNSDVQFRGVTVGTVGEIGLAPDGKLIQVTLHIFSKKFSLDTNNIIRLVTPNITGIKNLEIEMRDGRPDKSPKLSFAPPHPVISSYPSIGMMTLFTLMEKRLTELDTKGVSDGLTNSLYIINSFMSSKKVEKIIDDTSVSVQRIREISEQISPERIDKLSKNASDLMISLNRSAVMAETSIEPILQDLKRTIENLRSFSEALKDRPSQTLFSKPTEEK